MSELKLNPIIYFRPGGIQDEDELSAAKEFFDVTTSRVTIPKDSLVIPRYSALPFYKELEQDVGLLGSQLINNYNQHRFLADIERWYLSIQDLTPKTWRDWSDLPSDTAFVVKGKTNSRKHQWRTHMFASSREKVPEVANRLLDDDLVREQGLVVRKYVQLKKLAEGINGLPISNEWRFFVLDGKILCRGFYWASHPEAEPSSLDNKATALVEKVIERLSSSGVRFFVVDVAERADGRWIVIELNDAQMSGLSMIDPREFYSSLKSALN